MPLARGAPAGGQVFVDGSPLREPLAVLAEQLLVAGAGEPVERGALLGRAEQPQLVGLAVYGDDGRAHLGEHPGRDGPPAHVRPRPALGGHGAAEQHGAVVVDLAAGLLDAGLDHRRRRPGQPQPALHDRPSGVGPDPTAVGPAAEEQAEAGDHHRLTGAGLARDHGEAGPEGKGGVGDDAETGDAELVQHEIRR